MRKTLVGRPKTIKATRRQVEMLRADRYTWEQVAEKLGIGRATAIRLVQDTGVDYVRSKETRFGRHETIVLKPVILTRRGESS